MARALEEKQKIIADIFNIPPEDYETITDLVVGGDNSKDAKDVLLAVMAQADCLARLEVRRLLSLLGSNKHLADLVSAVITNAYM